jgi:hypothetical protein
LQPRPMSLTLGLWYGNMTRQRLSRIAPL